MRLGKRQLEMLKFLAAHPNVETIKWEQYVPLVKKGLVSVAYPMMTIFGHREVSLTELGRTELAVRAGQ